MEIYPNMTVEDFLIDLMYDRLNTRRQYKKRISAYKNDDNYGFRITGIFSYYDDKGILINSELFVDSINNTVIEKNKKEIKEVK